MTNEMNQKAAELMKKSETAVIALVDEFGFPRASVISCLKTDGVKHAWFATGLSTGKVRCLKTGNKGGLCFSDENNNVTLMGTVEVLTDRKSREDLWVDWFINHFPGGIDDPDYCILKFTAEKGVFWIDHRYQEIEKI